MNTDLTSTVDSANLGFLLDNLLTDIRGSHSAVVVSADGLYVAASNNLGRDDADRLCAVVSGLYSCCAGANRLLHGDGVVRGIIEMTNGWLFVSDIAAQARLAVHVGPGVDLSVVTYQMELAVQKIGRMMAVEVRSDTTPENG